MRRRPYRAVTRGSAWMTSALLLTLAGSSACSAVLGISDVPSVEDGAAPIVDSQAPDATHPDAAHDADAIDTGSPDTSSPDGAPIPDSGPVVDSSVPDAGGHDAAPTGIVLKGGIRPLGVPPAAGTVRLTHQGLTIPMGTTCNTSICIKSGGIAP